MVYSTLGVNTTRSLAGGPQISDLEIIGNDNRLCTPKKCYENIVPSAHIEN